MPEERPDIVELEADVLNPKSSLSAADRVRVVLATCFGIGYAPYFPGTLAALVAIPFYLPIAWYLPSEPAQTIGIAVAFVVWSAITVWLGGWSEVYFEKKDSSIFVTDEVAGLLLTLLIFHIPDQPILSLLWAFPVTRVIDIIKVPPAKRLEDLPKGWGVLADDLLGSVYAGLLLHLIHWLRPEWFTGGGA